MRVSFICECQNEISENIGVPEPNFEAERSNDSMSEEHDVITCSLCGAENELYITNSYSGAVVTVNGGQTEVNYSVAFYTDDEIEWVIKSGTQLVTFQLNLSSVQELIITKITEESAKRSLLVMLYAHVIASTEAHLAGTFIHRVTNSDELLRKLVENDPEFAKQTFSMKDIFIKGEQVKVIVAKYLKDIIFHKLEKVKPMYMSVLDVDFGDIAWLFKAVHVRHDCVHRAGCDKEGNPIEISEDDVLKIARQCSNFVYMIERTLLGT